MTDVLLARTERMCRRCGTPRQYGKHCQLCRETQKRRSPRKQITTGRATMTGAIVRTDGCFACTLYPFTGDTEATFRARVEANHQWSVNQHILGDGRLVMPRDPYEPMDAEDEPAPKVTICRRHFRVICMTCGLGVSA